MKALLTLAATSVLLISTSATSANFFGTTVKDILMTEKVSTRDEAYKAGTEKLSSLKASTPRELSHELNLFNSDIIERTVKLNSEGYVTVQERLGANGQLAYVGVVNIDVNYETNDNDN